MDGRRRRREPEGRRAEDVPPAPAEIVGLAERLPLPALVKRGEWTFDIAPDAAMRARIAAAYDLVRLPRLRFTGTIRRGPGEDWTLEGRLVARVVQPCGITLEEVETRIDEPVRRIFRPGHDLRKAPPGESEMPEEESDVEPLGGVIDLGALLLEAFDLALPAFPRAEGAALERREAAPPAVSVDRGGASPFAALADLVGGKTPGRPRDAAGEDAVSADGATADDTAAERAAAPSRKTDDDTG